MSTGSRHILSEQQKAAVQMQARTNALYTRDNLENVLGQRILHLTPPTVPTLAQPNQKQEERNWGFPHIVGSGYKPRRSGGLIDTFTASYMRWESRVHVIEWLRSFAHPLALRPVFLDVETTGARCFSEIIGVCVVNEYGQLLYHSLVNPTTEIEPIATSIHGLTHRDVMHAPRYSEVHEDVMQHLNNRVVIAYNVSFDLRLLRQSAARNGLAFPELHTACLMYAYAKYRAGSVEEAEGQPRDKMYRLDEALIHEGLDFPIRHRAEQDAQCVHRLFHAMRTRVL
jgi:DNA polymerase III epsilon subunit-like protein